MADRRVKVIFEAEIAKFKAGMAELSKSSKDAAKEAEITGKAVNKKAEAIRELGPTATIAGAGLVAGFGMAVKTFADFDKAMSSVQAATHETTGNMSLLREEAMRAGADTAFSAAEAAQGIEQLAKAGVTTEEIMGGGLSGALDLAAAGELAVGDAAEIAASAMTQFKLSGDQIPHLADLLAAGAGKAQGSVSDLGAALDQSGLVAASTGATIEETTGVLAAFASAGLTGSDAGTSFKTMLQQLTPASDKAATLMEDLGISAYDTNGEFIGMSEYAGVLQTALKDMSSEQRNATMKTIFGSDAVRAATVLYDQGAEGIQKWEDAVNDAGYAADTTALMQNNLAGDLEKLGGAFDTVFIKAGGAGNDAFRGVIQGLESVVDIVGKLPTPVLGAAGILTGLAGGALLLGGGLVTALPKIRDTRDALRDLAPRGSKAAKGLERVKGGMVGISKAAGAAGVIMAVGVGVGKLAEMSYTGDLIQGTGHVATALETVAKNGPGAAAALDSMFKDRNGGGITGEIDGIDTAIDKLFSDNPGEKFDRWGQTVVNSLTGIRGSKQIAEEAFGGIDTELAALVTSGNAEGAATSFASIQERMEAAGVSAEEAAYLFPQYADALSRTAGESGTASESQKVLKEALDEVGVSAEGVVEDMEVFLEQLFAAGVVTRDERGALREYEASIDAISESIKENGKSLDETTEKGRANQEAYDGIAASGQAYVEALAAGGASEKDLQAAMSGTYESLIVAAGQFGISGDKADAMARKVMGIPDDVSVSSWMSEQAKNTAEATKTAIDAIPKSTTIYTHYKTTGSQAGPLKVTPRDVLMESFVPKKAGGGEISGTGTKGVDSELIMAAPGEHMLTAREVDLMGGQDAVYRFRSELKQGVPAYAGGGAIGVMSGGFSSGGSSGAPSRSVSIKVDVHGATDGPAVARQVINEIGWKLNEQGLGVNL